MASLCYIYQKGHLIFGVIGSHPSIIRWYAKNGLDLMRGAKLMAKSPVGWNQPYIMGCAADNSLRESIKFYEQFPEPMPADIARLAKLLPKKEEIE